MMLVSLMRIETSVTNTRKCAGMAWLRLLENCEPGGKRRRRQAAHQSEASRRQVGGNGTRHLHHRPNAASVGGRRSPTRRVNRALKLPRLEKPTSMQTSVTECCPAREQLLGGVQARPDPKLVGRDAEDRLELPDEMKRRDLHLAREVRDRRGRLVQFPQQVARPAQAPEPFRS